MHTKRRVLMSCLGFIFLLASSGCGTESNEAECPAIYPWGDADDLLYVNAAINGKADAQSPDGTKANPFGTISEALEAAATTAAGAKGTAIIVAPGTYDEKLKIEVADFKNLPLSIVGWDQGKGEVSPEVIIKPPEGSGGIKIVGPGGGVPEIPSVELVGLSIVDATTAAVFVEAANATMENMVLDGVHVGEYLGVPAFGYGLWALADAKVKLTSSTIKDTAWNGVRLLEASGSIEGNNISDCGLSGIRLEVSSKVMVMRNELIGNRRAGIEVFSTTATIIDNTINDVIETVPGDELADGIVVGRATDEDGTKYPDSEVVIEDNIIRDSERMGILIADQTLGTVRNNTVSANRKGGVGIQGRGEDEVSEQAIEVLDNTVTGNFVVAVAVTGGGRVNMTGNTLGETQRDLVCSDSDPEEECPPAEGLGVFRNSVVVASDNMFVRSQRVDILLDAPGKSTVVQGSNKPEKENENFVIVLQNLPGLPADFASQEALQWAEIKDLKPGDKLYKFDAGQREFPE